METQAQYYTLTAEEADALPARVLAFIRQCTGKPRAVTAAMIAECIGYHDPEGRKIRVVIAQLIEQGHPIAAHGKGFFWVTTAEEARRYLVGLRSRATKIFRRYRAFAIAAEKCFGIAYEQLKLF